MSATDGLLDRLWGTRSHTQGAQLQLPRKIPLRIEPKSYFANERTFLSWTSMATTMGGVSSALMGFSLTSQDAAQSSKRLINRRTIDVISCIYIPVAIIMILYALFTFEHRSKFMQKKQVGFFHDQFGPVVIAVLVLLTMITITIMGLIDFFF